MRSHPTCKDAEIMDLLINIDVPDLGRAIAFYRDAFGLTVTRRFGADVVELSGWPVGLYLLQKPAGSPGAAGALQHYDRHWTLVHLDVVVDDLDAALKRALAAGAQAEGTIRTEAWGKSAYRGAKETRMVVPVSAPVVGHHVVSPRRPGVDLA